MKLKFTALFFLLTIAISSILINNALAQVHPKKQVTKSGYKKKGNSAKMEGKALIAKSDCLSCHRLDMKLIGPAYKDVAAKYPATEANYKLLTRKIIGGGNGTWGEVAMSPHSNLSKTDVKKMLVYILSIK